MGALPTFFVIGAAKAGTTSLHGYLGTHPEIAMSPVKEPRFFVADPGQAVASAGRVAARAAYEALFDPAMPHRGESSTSYSLFPLYRGVPRRIRTAVPGARLVYVVRDPVERAVSHYRQAYFSGTSFDSVERAFAAPEVPAHPFVCASRYATQLERYLEQFPLERIHVVDSADLDADPVAVVRAVVAFLGADPSGVPAGLSARANVTEGKRHPRAALTRLRRSPVVGRALASAPRSVQRPLRGAARAVLSRPGPPPTPSRVAFDRLRAHLAPEAERLRRLTGAAYETWTV